MRRIIAIILTVLTVILCLSGCAGSSVQDAEKTITVAELKQTISSTELYAVETTFKSNFPVVLADDEEEIQYYLYYEATVTAGIDFEDIAYDINEDERTIVITIPEIQILEKYVDEGSFDRIFIEKKANSSDMDYWDRQLCEEDLDEKLEEEKDKLFSSAQENIITFVEGMTKPWVESTTDYKVTVKGAAEDA